MSKCFTKEEQKKLIGKIIFKKFKIINLIAKGGFSCVYEGINLNTKEKVAIKIEKRSFINYLETECFILKEVEGYGIPKIISFGISGHYYILILEILGDSLFSIMVKNKKPFCIKDICMIALQIIDRIEHVHSKYILHRDIKPDNFLIGNNNPNVIYLIDFGFSKKFRSSQTKKHFKFYKLNSFIGSREFISINGNKGIAPTRRDDLESAGFMFIFFAKGSLPWFKLQKGLSLIEKAKKTLKIKNEITLEKLCENLPYQFLKYMKYCRNLSFEQEPNYEYLKNLFNDILQKNNLTNDLLFSWVDKINLNLNSSKKFDNKNSIDLSKRKDSSKNRLYKKIKNSLSEKKSLTEKVKKMQNLKSNFANSNIANMNNIFWKIQTIDSSDNIHNKKILNSGRLDNNAKIDLNDSHKVISINVTMINNIKNSKSNGDMLNENNFNLNSKNSFKFNRIFTKKKILFNNFNKNSSPTNTKKFNNINNINNCYYNNYKSHIPYKVVNKNPSPIENISKYQSYTSIFNHLNGNTKYIKFNQRNVNDNYLKTDNANNNFNRFKKFFRSDDYRKNDYINMNLKNS